VDVQGAKARPRYGAGPKPMAAGRGAMAGEGPAAHLAESVTATRRDAGAAARGREKGFERQPLGTGGKLTEWPRRAGASRLRNRPSQDEMGQARHTLVHSVPNDVNVEGTATTATI